MHSMGILSIRFTSQKEVNKGKEALTVFIEKCLGCQENLPIGNNTLPLPRLDGYEMLNNGVGKSFNGIFLGNQADS